MDIESALRQRAADRCELCGKATELGVYEVHPRQGTLLESSALVCATCQAQLPTPAAGDQTHWYGLAESMWSEFPAVKVLVYRVLKGMGDNSWAQDLLGQLYLDDGLQAWADAGVVREDPSTASPVIVVDSNGTPLLEGDTVTLIKDLVVKGANFTAKRGTTVKNIHLTDDPKLIEGRVNGTSIVLVTAYLKKA